jgi:hypothetical protein
LTEQFGPFKSVRIGSYETVPGDSLFNLQASCWIICSFQEGERNGSARFALKAMTDRYSLLPLLIELRIDLVDGKELVLPAEQESEDGT